MASTTPDAKTYGFQTEVKQLLRLLSESLYSNRDVFLRELVSNASDAIDKRRLERLSTRSLTKDTLEGDIAITIDPAQRTLTVEDNGVGMTEQGLKDQLGTIAHSGTRQYLDALAEQGKQDSAHGLIGQFGVGFYSAFVVADRVTVDTRAEEAPSGYRWVSEGTGEYTIEAIDRDQVGTRVTLHLREDADDYLAPWRLRQIVATYSNHINVPVHLTVLEADSDDTEADDNTKPEPIEHEQINQAQALWRRDKASVTDEAYVAAYQELTHHTDTPMAWAHHKVEGGKATYTSLLYVPSQAPFDLWHPNMRRGLKLFVRRVFILDEADHFLPSYLRFIKGVIDTDDLPLNVSREMLQDNQQVQAIRAGCTKRVLNLLKDKAEHAPGDYQTFWNTFGKVLKEGIAEDYTNRDNLMSLMRFASTHRDDDVQAVSLADYVARMKPDQTKIYYCTAESHQSALSSPHLEAYRQAGVEVLLMVDRIDAWLMSQMPAFEGKTFQSVSQGEFDMPGDLADDNKTANESEFADVVSRMAEVLKGSVKTVRLSQRLTDSPACLVADAQDMSQSMKRLLEEAGQAIPETKPILEVNPNHPLVTHLLHTPMAEHHFEDWSKVLHDQAMLAEGGQLTDPGGYVKRFNTLVTKLLPDAG